ncbi:hypothetical protein psyc5s11_03360 [Clostridium gelidum]|uniref:DUF4097 domain-containing protein n=1 Tax=Clostridium gelidum TaxID=704125 RepID=A0ABM7SXU2_9CLOT|nr:DUF4097 family beta strand repeat-containing protein [Clostridium gelidum]BCZ44269.1 hypothetical protein psyc5s11_03360 [Clostridium gelidum]
MNKVLIVAIIGILTISFIGCDIKSKEKSVGNKEENITQTDDNVKSAQANDESENLNGNKLIDEKVALDDATDINIEICAAEVSIKSYDGEDVKITGKLSEKSKGIDINKNGNKIEIIEKDYKVRGFIMDSENNSSKFNILVPLKLKGDFEFKQGAGTTDIEGIKVKNINISGGATKLKCEDIRFDKLNLNLGAAKVGLNLNEKCGDIVINGGVGEVNIKMAEVGGNLTYKGGVGIGNITIPENSPVRFVTQNGVGKCEVKAKTSGKDTYTFDLKVGAGSISVRN